MTKRCLPRRSMSIESSPLPSPRTIHCAAKPVFPIPQDLSAHKKGRVVRCEKQRVFCQNPGDCGLPSEFPVQKPPDFRSVPALRVRKAGIERQVPFVEWRSCELHCVGAVDRHIENRKIQEIDKRAVTESEIKRVAGLILGFRGGPEKEDIRTSLCLPS